jgi:hypothetical protein
VNASIASASLSLPELQQSMVKVLAHRTSSPHQGFGHAPAAPSSYMSTVPSSCIKLRRYLPQNHLTLRAAGAENLHRYATATVAAAALNTTNARSPAMQHPAAALRYAELFCGLGAFSYALHRALAACGAPPPQLVAAADVDQVAGQVYAHNHGAVPSNTDLSRVDATRYVRAHGMAVIDFATPPGAVTIRTAILLSSLHFNLVTCTSVLALAGWTPGAHTYGASALPASPTHAPPPPSSEMRATLEPPPSSTSPTSCLACMTPHCTSSWKTSQGSRSQRAAGDGWGH